MAEYHSMQYKTLGGAVPQGRPRVFFCCAAADFEACFDVITDEILSIQPNAAIWYLDPREGSMEGEAFLADLSQMQLLVVPVTTAFLRQDRPDPARTVAFPYAMEHHIPVLPLMQEPGLESTFNEICGALQVLDRYAAEQDSTTLPYEEKLKRFLDGVLVSNALAERVRAAFDAYIFLSYRKKDRAAAQKIMGLIHENDFCRDVAIWYDEFLTPGENFNNAIASAMEKSVLFALVVTPNLLENPNYVMSTEYPAARKMEKPILPLEAEDTDAAALSRLYDGIRETAPAADPETITARLRQLLTTEALRENDDPAHSFLMGIAYLSGIDVEVNHRRAVKLITEAAEAELLEAMEKLVSMYETGEGVERSFETAIQWRERIAEHWRKATEADPSEYNTDRWFWRMFDLGNALLDHGEFRRLEQLQQMMLQCAEIMQTHGYRYARRNLSVVYEKMGALCRESGRLEEAVQWQLKALALSEAEAAEIGTANARRDLANEYDNAGRIQDALGHLQEAENWYKKSFEIRKALVEETGTVDAWDALSTSLRNLGDMRFQMGEIPESLDWYRKSLKVSEVLAAETNAADERRKLSVAYGRMGKVYMELRRPKEAEEWYRKSLEFYEELAAKTGTVQARRALAIDCDKMGKTQYMLGHPEETERWYRRSYEIRQTLADEIGTLEARRDYGISLGKMGDACHFLRRYEEAERWYRKRHDISLRLADEAPTVDTLGDLAVACHRLGHTPTLPTEERRKFLTDLQKLSTVLLQKTGRKLYQKYLDFAQKELSELDAGTTSE